MDWARMYPYTKGIRLNANRFGCLPLIGVSLCYQLLPPQTLLIKLSSIKLFSSSKSFTSPLKTNSRSNTPSGLSLSRRTALATELLRSCINARSPINQKDTLPSPFNCGGWRDWDRFTLFNAIVSPQPFLHHNHPDTCDYQAWSLAVSPGRMASLTCALDNAAQAIRQEILLTDFPLPEITLYCFDNVLLLPSENWAHWRVEKEGESAIALSSK